jgi:ComF family protein
MKKIINWILDLILPIQCLGCGKEGQFFCGQCLEKIPLKLDFEKQKTNSPLSGLIIASDYQHPLLKEALIQYKYNFVSGLAQPLSQLLIKQLNLKKHQFLINAKTIFVSVPLHQRRLRWRGFNQSELLCQNLGKHFHLPFYNDILIRQKNTLPQAKISDANQRQNNIKNAFQINPGNAVDLKNKTIILVDDISTTGATLSECAKALKSAGAKNIYGLVLAHG